MCHLGADRLEQLDSPLPCICKPCLQGKQHQAPFPHVADRAHETLGRIFSDVHSPMQVGGHQSNRRWWVTFVDDSTRWMEVYDMYRKSDVLSAFKTFKAQAERHVEKAIKCVHFDKGGEYTSNDFLSFCRSEGIHVEFTNTATPQQNGVAERMNRTIEESITSMLTEAKLPPSFWTYALSAYRHVHNRCPTSALPRNTTPFEAYKGKKPRIGHLRVFGCAAYVLIVHEKRKGLDGHSLPGIFVGYPDNHVGWKVYILTTKQVVVSRDIVFNESCFPGLSFSGTPQPPLESFSHFNIDDYDDHTEPAVSRRNESTEPPLTSTYRIDDGEPLTPLPSDDEEGPDSVGGDPSSVGDNPSSVGDPPIPVGVEHGDWPTRAHRQPCPLPPP